MQVTAIAHIWEIAIPTIVWAHHPLPRSATDGDGPRFLLWLLGASVFGVVFVVTWALFSFVERRRQSGSGGQESSPRS
jgi:hypothetical protein